LNRTRPHLLTKPPPRSPPPPEHCWNDVDGVNYLTIVKNQVRSKKLNNILKMKYNSLVFKSTIYECGYSLPDSTYCEL
jgi:hypothetical protein